MILHPRRTLRAGRERCVSMRLRACTAPSMSLLPVVVLLVAVVVAPTGTQGKPLIVELPDGSGAVEGLDLRDGATGSFEVNAFLGIPFARPPTKMRRWTSPERNLPWKGVRPAKQFAPNCMQLDPPAWGTMKKNVSEDCLYLNVWTPAQEEGEQQELTYPVMVFIHGGGYVSAAVIPPHRHQLLLIPRPLQAYGGAYDSELDGSSLCDLADVVVVTIQYRVDIFGWLGSDQLRSRSEDNSTGNWGAQDQRMAMRWVHNNIAAFHGVGAAVTSDKPPALVTPTCISSWIMNVLMQVTPTRRLYSERVLELGRCQIRLRCASRGDCFRAPSLSPEVSRGGLRSRWPKRRRTMQQ